MTKQRPDSWVCFDDNGNVNQNCPHERTKKFNLWVRDKLPDSSTGFVVSDLDFILHNWKTRKLMLVEVKTMKSKMEFWQEKLFKLLDELMKANAGNMGIKYYGFKCIRFEGTCFTDGRCMVDSKLVTESELIKILSME